MDYYGPQQLAEEVPNQNLFPQEVRKDELLSPSLPWFAFSDFLDSHRYCEAG